MHIESTPAQQARHVVERTGSAWRIAPASPREVARCAPRVHVPARVVLRIQAAAVAAGLPLLAHSW
ncbi:hypothetical protein QTI17_02455 [Variovorax sp. J31P179]|jgi:hypothetical protein|uniref:hypothetical protein n=1 Tax=Variovorax sp. J31P179 TaxID=3053508 RepID=UPI0025778ADA|nr:hypothetical protein [Variovorax sp. J31P179]MDM0079443.1 hypothetical protein [Variovorax sp. J31P179]